MNRQDNAEDDYKQIFFSNQLYFNDERNILIRIDLTHRLYVFIFIFLILISQSITTALPVPSMNYYHVKSYLTNRPQLLDQLTSTMPNYSNRLIVQVMNNNQRQLKRERYRRSMIDRLFTQFDEDADGQLSKDELYSLSLRMNIFPHFHHFLKTQQEKSQ